MNIKKFYNTQVEFDHLHARFKIIDCPHCKANGFLILHGFLYGHADTHDTVKIVRGRRIFCSNRNKKSGCGRTFSVLKATTIKNFTIPAKILWCYLNNIINGMNKTQAFNSSGSAMGASSIFRIYKRFKNNQVRIRTVLSSIKDPPQLNHTNNPIILSIMHLKTVFKNSFCPISKFQHHFQASFLQ